MYFSCIQHSIEFSRVEPSGLCREKGATNVHIASFSRNRNDTRRLLLRNFLKHWSCAASVVRLSIAASVNCVGVMSSPGRLLLERGRLNGLNFAVKSRIKRELERAQEELEKVRELGLSWKPEILSLLTSLFSLRLLLSSGQLDRPWNPLVQKCMNWTRTTWIDYLDSCFFLREKHFAYTN